MSFILLINNSYFGQYVPKGQKVLLEIEKVGSFVNKKIRSAYLTMVFYLQSKPRDV